VVGGGNTAIDAARTALRLGAASVNLVYRRTREEMPAQALEVHEAEEEGIKMTFLANPSRVIGVDKVEGLELIMQDLGEFDDSSRRRPIPITGSEYVMPVDIILPAIGQGTDVSCAENCGITFNRNTTLKVDRKLSTTRPGVFAAGDVVLGPATVVEAVAQGNEVAMMVDEFLQKGEGASKEDWLAYDNLPNVYNMEAYATATRIKMPVQASESRKHTWQEVELGFEEAACREECNRCLRCDIDK
jgi:NADPH-dependent glutamate synthase beta subunit-like oxidoreductase